MAWVSVYSEYSVTDSSVSEWTWSAWAVAQQTTAWTAASDTRSTRCRQARPHLYKWWWVSTCLLPYPVLPVSCISLSYLPPALSNFLTASCLSCPNCLLPILSYLPPVYPGLPASCLSWETCLLFILAYLPPVYPVLPASCPILYCPTYLLPYPAVSPFYLFGLHLHAPPVQHAHPAQDVFLVLFYVPHQPYLFHSPFPRFYITSLSYLFCPSCYKFLTCAFCATLPRYLPVQ